MAKPNPRKFRVWVAGPRAWENPEPLELVMKKLISKFGIARLLVMTGGAPGVDHLVEEICFKEGVHCFRCRAAWPVGRHAGPMRNGVIADEFGPKLLIALHYMPLKDGTNHPGTQNAMKQAKRRGIPVRSVHVEPEVAIPSSIADNSPMGNRARAERGLAPKAKKRQRARRKPTESHRKA